ELPPLLHLSVPLARYRQQQASRNSFAAMNIFSPRRRAMTGNAGDAASSSGRPRSLSTTVAAAAAAGTPRGARGAGFKRSSPRAPGTSSSSVRMGEYDAFKESVLDTLGRTDLRAIDDGLRNLYSKVEADLTLGGLQGAFSDDEDDDSEDDESDADTAEDDASG
ncbi:unnamed protein product, partial [Ectocarpus sp. 13 AM-2016]